MRQYASLCERDLRESPVLSNMGPRYFDATGTQDGDTRNLAKCNTLVHTGDRSPTGSANAFSERAREAKHSCLVT